MKKKRIPLAWQTVLAAILGAITGKAWPQAAEWAGMLAPAFMRMLGLLIIPYIFSGICSAFTRNSDRGFAGRIMLKSVSGFVTMEVLAIATALAASNILFMSAGIELPSMPASMADEPREFGDFLLAMIPGDIASVFTRCNLPAVVLAACIAGHFSCRCPDRSRIFLSGLYASASDVMQGICDLVSALCPLGVFCMFCRISADGAVLEGLGAAGPLLAASLAGLGIHALVSIPAILKISSGVRPYRLLKQFSNSLYTSLTFASSTCAVPMAINRMKQDTGISARVADFAMPVVSVLNFNGTSIFLATAAMYVAQAYGINLSIMEQVVLMFAVSFITIGTVACPLRLSATLYPVMESMGIPLEGMGAVAVCELMFGMLCSMVDLWGNIAVTVNIAEGEGDRIVTEHQEE